MIVDSKVNHQFQLQPSKGKDEKKKAKKGESSSDFDDEEDASKPPKPELQRASQTNREHQVR
jgi:hypothetical protein